MTRWLTILLLFSVALAAVAEPALAQGRPGAGGGGRRPATTRGPEADNQDRPRGPSRREGRFQSRRQGGGSRRAAVLKAMVQRDLVWLGEHNMTTAYCDRVKQLLSSDDPRDRIRLWQVHRRIQQWRQLAKADLGKAFEEVRLEFESCDLANRAREAPRNAQEKLKRQLREVIARQFDLRIDVQKASLAANEKRLSEIEKRLKTQERIREELIAKRLEQLLDNETDLPDPLGEVLAEPQGEAQGAKPPTREPRDGPSTTPRRDNRNGPRGGPGFERLRQRLDANLKWLEAHNLKAFAERVKAIREAGSSDGYLLLWRVHRWIEQQKRLERSGTDPKDALKSVRLAFSIAEMAGQLRRTDVANRPALESKLQKALGRQFEARQQRGQRLLAIMRSGLKKHQRGIKKQVQNRRRLIARRVKHLMDPRQGPAEPELVPGEMFNPSPPRR